jgi:hypothetical protein
VVTLGAADLPAPGVPADEVRRAAAEVLSRPEFALPSPTPLARLRSWLAEQAGRLLEGLIGSGGGSLVATVVLAVLVLAVVLLAVRLVRGTRRDPRTGGAVVDEQLGRSPAHWEAEARAHEQAGRERQALRCRYRWLIAVLAERGLVDEVPGRTSGEYLAALAEVVPPARPAFARVTAGFEAVWYGDAAADGAALAAFRRDAEAVVRVAGERRRAGDGQEALSGAAP